MWTYRAALIQVTDGDSLKIELDLGCSVRTQQDVRLLAVSAPELSQPGGVEATEFVRAWMSPGSAFGPGQLRWPLLVTTSPNTSPEPLERRSFTRYLATVADIADGRILNDALRDYLAQHPEWGSGS